MGPFEYVWNRPAIASAEIIILFLFFYAILRVMGGTRVSGILRGLVVGFILLYAAVQYLAREFALERVQGLLSALVGALGITTIVVFAPDLRRAMARMAESPLLFPFLRPRESKIVDQIADAAVSLARKRVGGLVVIERDIGLRGFTGTATQLDAEVTAPLLESLFYPGSPLHDGATVLREGRVAAAGVVLPLSESPDLGPELGTRHRAGVGITEETDAIAVIISEERGTVSVAVRGKLIRDLERDRLRDLLRELMAREERGEVPVGRGFARLARRLTGRHEEPAPQPPKPESKP